MNELIPILQAWRNGGTLLQDAVLVSVIDVRGSSLSRPGTHLLVLPDGRRVGSLGDERLERDVTWLVPRWMAGAQATVRAIALDADDHPNGDPDVSCVATLLAERVSEPRAAEVLEFLSGLLAARRHGVVATVVRAQSGARAKVGDRLLIDSNGGLRGTLPPCFLETDLLAAAEETVRERTHHRLRRHGCELFLEWIAPPQRLVILGADRNAIPLAHIARLLGWTVTVADTRPDLARRERFPDADHVVTIPVSGPDIGVEINRDTAVVIMGQERAVGRRLLPWVLDRAPRYLGLLGSRSRAELLFQDIGRRLDDWDVYAPVGLDIGCEQPEAIALAILAEIHAVVSRRPAGSRRGRCGPPPRTVHEYRAPRQSPVTDNRGLGEFVLAQGFMRAPHEAN